MAKQKGLTTNHIESLRAAHDFVARITAAGAEAHLYRTDDDGETHEVIVPMARPVLHEHGDSDQHLASVCWVLQAVHFSPAYQTAMHTLVPGDLFRFVLHIDDSAPAVRAAGITVDSIAIEIGRRRTDNSVRWFHHILDTQVIAPYSPSRHVRYDAATRV